MPDYRRNRVHGGSYFFTINLSDRRSNLLTAHIDALRDSSAGATRASHSFHIDGWVVWALNVTALADAGERQQRMG